jgi:hypothetical protein
VQCSSKQSAYFFCAGCHIAYPPDLLPPDSWRKILFNLNHHFVTQTLWFNRMHGKTKGHFWGPSAEVDPIARPVMFTPKVSALMKIQISI